MSDEEIQDDVKAIHEAMQQLTHSAAALTIANVDAAAAVEMFLEKWILEVEADLGIPEANIKSTREILGALNVQTETIKYSDHIGIWIPWTQVHKLYKLLIKLITEEDLSDNLTD